MCLTVTSLIDPVEFKLQLTLLEFALKDGAEDAMLLSISSGVQTILSTHSLGSSINIAMLYLQPIEHGFCKMYS